MLLQTEQRERGGSVIIELLGAGSTVLHGLLITAAAVPAREDQESMWGVGVQVKAGQGLGEEAMSSEKTEGSGVEP